MTLNDPLGEALDRFAVPPMAPGMVDRIVEAATAGRIVPVPRRRSHRVLWRGGPRAVLGGIAVVLASAAALASGLVGSGVLRLPVFAEMKPRAPVVQRVADVPKPVHRVRPAKPRAAPVTEIAIAEPTPPAVAPIERLAARVARQADRREFIEEHPRAAMMIARRVRQQLRQRALARQAALAPAPLDGDIPGWRAPVESTEGLALESLRDRRRARAMIDRRIERFRRRAELRQGLEPTEPPATVP